MRGAGHDGLQISVDKRELIFPTAPRSLSKYERMKGVNFILDSSEFRAVR